eukprot:CAMPEP_0172199108 /NCGR_PEP_ID=MMETSP1050-20130122/28487_1 /TAXON_ID=233186 /ORGANISM="Cryptomonas curvata, Strain CCAP979/52" /LENGTH=87 /DNA_ID=CAMNT_0012876059 /DNA_START=31 /DNA_END=294 /DNA_ORIENTATION=-
MLDFDKAAELGRAAVLHAHRGTALAGDFAALPQHQVRQAGVERGDEGGIRSSGSAAVGDGGSPWEFRSAASLPRPRQSASTQMHGGA